MKIKPIGNKLIVERDKNDCKNTYTTSSGIIVKRYDEKRHKGRYAIGNIVSMGKYFHDKDGNLIKMGSVFKEGDKIVYYYPSENIINFNGKRYCFIRAEDIEMVIDPDKKSKLDEN